MTGQLSLFDFPEVIPEYNPDMDLAEILWKNAYPSIKGYISGGGDSVEMVKKKYGTSGGTAQPEGLIMYDNSGVSYRNGSINKKVNWKEYIRLLKSYSAKVKG